MKILLLLSIFIMTNLYAEATPPHLGPMGGQFNRLYVLQVEKSLQNNLDAADSKKLEMLLAVGKRAGLWLQAINKMRPTDAQLDLAMGASTSTGMPIDKPMKTSTDILMKRYQEFLDKTSPLITDVVTSTRDFPTTLPVEQAEFIKALRTLDNIFQGTVRWAGAQTWISWYINRSIYDVRGYLFLKQTPDLEATLRSFDKLTTLDKEKFSSWLLGLCRNGDFEISDCQTELKTAISKNRMFDFYNRFNKYGQSMYDLFFKVTKTRPEIKWNTNRTVLNAPFLTPERADVKTWLKTNVENEWKDVNFNLSINYQNSTPNIPRIQFKEGVVANVNGIGGDIITMDSLYSIESNSSRWTIRHEYGHVLGFTDCYLEFYDTIEKAMVYYEIEVDNLMCSRSGRLKPIHQQLLQSAYK